MSDDLIKRSDAIEVAYQLRHKPNDEQWDWWLRSFNAIPSADKPSAVDLSSVYSTAYKSGYEKGKADRPQEWVDKAISIIDDMQREGIIDYEQAWEFRMRARMKGE